MPEELAGCRVEMKGGAGALCCKADRQKSLAWTTGRVAELLSTHCWSRDSHQRSAFRVSHSIKVRQTSDRGDLAVTLKQTQLLGVESLPPFIANSCCLPMRVVISQRATCSTMQSRYSSESAKLGKAPPKLRTKPRIFPRFPGRQTRPVWAASYAVPLFPPPAQWDRYATDRCAGALWPAPCVVHDAVWDVIARLSHSGSW